jgi:fructokinase
VIAVAGEALIDLVAADGTLHPVPGGGPFNTAVALGRFGVPVGFVGRLSTDGFGRLLARQLAQSGVDLRYTLYGDAPTPLAVVDTAEDGEPYYTFYLSGTAYADIAAEDLPSFSPEVAALHVASLALATDPPAGALEVLLEREAPRRLILIDPNVRPAVIADREGFRRRFESWAALADVIKLSAADVEWLYPELEPATLADRVLGLGARLVLVTLGARGALARSAAGARAQAAAPAVAVVDTIGAGDTFNAGVLRALWAADRLDSSSVARLDDAELSDALAFATAAATLQCTRRGAAPPTVEDVEAFLGRG